MVSRGQTGSGKEADGTETAPGTQQDSDGIRRNRRESRLHVVLLEGVRGGPAEGCSERLCAYRVGAGRSVRLELRVERMSKKDAEGIRGTQKESEGHRRAQRDAEGLRKGRMESEGIGRHRKAYEGPRRTKKDSEGLSLTCTKRR